MKRHHLILPALVLLAASAAGQPDIITTRFKQLDKNGDGKISRAESDTFVNLRPRFRDNPKDAKQLVRAASDRQ
jgi:hypothetical protein